MNRAASSLGTSYEQIKVVCAPLDAIAYEGLISGRTTVSEKEIGNKHKIDSNLFN